MRYIYFISLAALLFSSCGEDAFSTTVNIPFPEHEPLPSITLDMRSGDTTVFTRVSLSRGIVDEPKAVTARPTLTILRGGNEILSTEVDMPDSDGQQSGFVLDNPIDHEEDEYELRLEFPGFETTTAIQQMPSLPIVTNLDYEEDGAIDTEGFRVDKIEFDLTDNPMTEDYYGFRVLAESCYEQCIFDPDTGVETCEDVCTGYFNESYLLSPDPTFKEASAFGLVLNDKSFTSGTFRVRLTADNFSGDSAFLEVYHITEDAYRFGISRLAYENSRNNPFAEPVNVHTNVEKGYGHFILSNRVRVALE